jgi:NO-binding membrane sensor protein with MHYT domain
MIAATITAIGFIVSMLMAGRIAESRGRSMRAWIWFAAIFGPLATLAAWALPAKRAPSHAGVNGH